MKILVLFTSILLFSCSQKKAQPTAKQKVEKLQQDCKNAAKDIEQRQKEKSFYDRLRKEEGIREFSSKLYDAHKNNAEIGHMFKDVDKGPFVERVVQFLSAGTGGNLKYEGRSMKEVHKDMNISNQDFLTAGGDVEAVMKEMKYGQNEIQEMVCALVSFVPVVVTRE